MSHLLCPILCMVMWFHVCCNVLYYVTFQVLYHISCPIYVCPMYVCPIYIMSHHVHILYSKSHLMYHVTSCHMYHVLYHEPCPISWTMSNPISCHALLSYVMNHVISSHTVLYHVPCYILCLVLNHVVLYHVPCRPISCHVLYHM